jgi:hypothetical protein
VGSFPNGKSPSAGESWRLCTLFNIVKWLLLSDSGMWHHMIDPLFDRARRAIDESISLTSDRRALHEHFSGVVTQLQQAIAACRGGPLAVLSGAKPVAQWWNHGWFR